MNHIQSANISQTHCMLSVRTTCTHTRLMLRLDINVWCVPDVDASTIINHIVLILLLPMLMVLLLQLDVCTPKPNHIAHNTLVYLMSTARILSVKHGYTVHI